MLFKGANEVIQFHHIVLQRAHVEELRWADVSQVTQFACEANLRKLNKGELITCICQVAEAERYLIGVNFLNIRTLIIDKEFF